MRSKKEFSFDIDVDVNKDMVAHRNISGELRISPLRTYTTGGELADRIERAIEREVTEYYNE